MRGPCTPNIWRLLLQSAEAGGSTFLVGHGERLRQVRLLGVHVRGPPVHAGDGTYLYVDHRDRLFAIDSGLCPSGPLLDAVDHTSVQCAEGYVVARQKHLPRPRVFRLTRLVPARVWVPNAHVLAVKRHETTQRRQGAHHSFTIKDGRTTSCKTAL